MRDPGAIALLAPGRPPLTYRGLLREVGRTVNAFAAGGLGQGSRIGVALPNGAEMAVALLAAADCATCVPLNPAMDAAACRHLLESMRLDALVVPDGEDSPMRQVANAAGLPALELAYSAEAAIARLRVRQER